jgi:arylsulfatase
MLFAYFALWCDSVTGATPHQPRPNIVVIMSDDMGYSDIGCYGGEIQTPTLDRLAEGGIRFTQFYNTARCCPTRAALLTGLYSHQAGVGHMTQDYGHDAYRGNLSRNAVTLAEALKPAGYGTYMCGKWHVTGQERRPDASQHNWPRQRGFDRFYGTITGAGSFYDPTTLCRDNQFITPHNDTEYQPNAYYYTDAISDNAVRFVRDHRQTAPDKPFFLYVAYTAAHWPMHALPEDIEKYRGKYDAGYEPIRQARLERMKRLGLVSSSCELCPPVGDWDRVKNREWETRCMEVYVAMIDRMDQGIAKIVTELNEQRVLDNTLILFLQDNGGCAEGIGRTAPKQPYPTDLKPLGKDGLQPQISPPMQTRDGRPVRVGPDAMPGPEDTYIAYGQGWAHVSNTPFREYKHWQHEGGISSPLIAHWPQGIATLRRGKLEAQPAHLIDIMATCVDLAQAKYPQQYNSQTIQPPEGVSLRPAFNGESLQRNRPLFWEHEGNRAVRQGQWKLVAKHNQDWELYDIEVDRSELHDLAERMPERVRELSQAWAEWAKRVGVQPWPVKKRPVVQQASAQAAAAAAQQKEEPAQLVAGRLLTRWAKDVSADNVHPEYPRPQMARKTWQNLNGSWDFALLDRQAAQPTEYRDKILVPFPVESSLSGVTKYVGQDKQVWYRRSFALPESWNSQRVLVHFGAVDWEATVFVDGQEVGTHRGGYDPFSFDITEAVAARRKERKPHEIVVRVWDPTDDGTQPRGKQVNKPRGIWYTPVTGIWQTVWLEPVPETHIESLLIEPDADRKSVSITVKQQGKAKADVRVVARDSKDQEIEAIGRSGEPAHITLPKAELWSPDHPRLYDLRVELRQGGHLADMVETYCAFRKIELGKDQNGITRILLNGKPLFQFGPLDQGWWPDGLYTAPTDEAMRYDLEVTQKFGFNLVRKHVKVEPQRWYHYCDKMGLLVWQDMPSGDANARWPLDGTEDDRTPAAAKQFEQELTALIQTHRNHPSIVCWVPFNEAWGQFDTEHWTRFIKEMDPSRLVISASGGNDFGVGDIRDIHFYPQPEAPPAEDDRAVVLGEYGGLGLPLTGHTWQDAKNWGYRRFESQEELQKTYLGYIEALRPMIESRLSAAIYTQTTDVEIEVNGLMTYDRAVLKFDSQTLAKAHARLYDLLPKLTKPEISQAYTIAHWRFEEGQPGELLPHDRQVREGFAVRDVSGHRNHLYAFGEKNAPRASSETPAGQVPLLGQANRGALDDTVAGNGGTRDLFTDIARSRTHMDAVGTYPFNEWTIEASIRPAALGSTQTIVGEDGQPTSEPHAPLQLQLRDDNRIAIAALDSTGTLRTVASRHAVETGRWYHVAATSDGQTLKLFVKQDGDYELQGETFFSGALLRNVGTWTVGRGHHNGQIAHDAQAMIDEVRVSTIALPVELLLWSASATGEKKAAVTPKADDAPAATGKPLQPKIVLVLADDMGPGDLGCYGGTVCPTPNIDRMAEQGTRYTQYYSASPICSPSRAGLLTGMFPARWRITSFLQTRAGNRGCEQADYLDPAAPSLPRALKAAGYKTAHFGKWHVGGGRDVTDAPRFAAYGYDEHAGTWESPEPHPDITAGNWIWSDQDKVKRWDRSAFFVDRTLDFLARHKSQPCFVNLWLDDVHTPWVPGPDAGKDENTPKNLRRVLKETDRQIGRLLDGLRELGIDDQTLVIFTSDNGAMPTFKGARSAGLRGSKGTLYEGGVRMPFIARWPGLVPAARTDETTVLAAVDLFPTLCAIAGAERPKGHTFDGQEMSMALAGTPVERRSPLFWEYGRNDEFFRYPATDRSPNVAVREGRWKLLVNADGSSAELYDVVTDTSESTNQAEQQPEITQRLKHSALNWRRMLP